MAASDWVMATLFHSPPSASAILSSAGLRRWVVGRKRGSGEYTRRGNDSSLSSNDGEYIPEGGAGGESEGSRDDNGECDNNP
jgi:hypothetical protein